MGISNTMWGVYDKDSEAWAIVRSGASSHGGWSDGDLTNTGRLAREYFKSENPAPSPPAPPSPAPTPAPPTPPTPAPPAPTPPTPSPSGCPGGSLAACIGACPSDLKAYKAC